MLEALSLEKMYEYGPQEKLLAVHPFFTFSPQQGPDSVGGPSFTLSMLEDGPQNIPGSMFPIQGIGIERKHEKPNPVLAKDLMEDTSHREEGEIGASIVSSASKQERDKCPAYIPRPVRPLIIRIME